MKPAYKRQVKCSCGKFNTFENNYKGVKIFKNEDKTKDYYINCLYCNKYISLGSGD